MYKYITVFSFAIYLCNPKQVVEKSLVNFIFFSQRLGAG